MLSILTSLLNKYPEFKSFYHIPEAYKTEADLLNAPEVEQAGANFIRLYSNIIEKSEKHFDETVRNEAIELNRQGIRTSQVKVTCLRGNPVGSLIFLA